MGPREALAGSRREPSRHDNGLAHRVNADLAHASQPGVKTMTDQNRLTQATERYSPRPREAYGTVTYGVALGPNASPLLDTPQAWNLAYLTYDFEANPVHPDVGFSTLVRRSTQVRLADGTLGLADELKELTGSWLLLPAPRFVYLIRNFKFLSEVPLYQVYGQAWLDNIEARGRLCQAGFGQPDALDCDSEVTDSGNEVAQGLFDRLRRH